MVALALLAAGLMAVSDVVGGALRNHVTARQLDVATLLARGKLAAVQDDFQEKGFRDFDDTSEGSFEDEGHPELKWKLEVLRPDVGPDGAALVQKLTGGKGLEDLLGLGGNKDKKSPDGIETLYPGAAALLPMLQGTLNQLAAQLKQNLREVRLTVSWAEGRRTESFTVRTHVFLQGTPGVTGVTGVTQ
jgi:general secretion pathway protein I